MSHVSFYCWFLFFSFSIIVLLLFLLFAFAALLHSLSCLALRMPCCFRTMLFLHLITPCCCALLLSRHALLLLHLATGAFTPYYSCFFATPTIFYVHALLPYHYCLAIAPCRLPFTGTSWPPPYSCFITLLLIIAPCCSALLIGIPSSLSCVGRRAWNNTNKLHPTTKVFFFLNFLSFFFLCFVFCLFCFCLSFCFKLNTFCLSVVCEFSYVVDMFVCV